MKTPLPPLCILLPALVLSACKPEAPQMQPPPPTAVTVAAPVKQKVKEWDEFTGRVDAAKSVVLYSQVTGYLMSIDFKDGSEVKKGTLLFQIDPRPFQAVLDQALAQHEQAKVKLELSRSEYDRASKLLDSKAISAEDYDTRSKAVREAEAGLRVTQAAVDKAKLDVEYTQIKAPMDGRLGRKLMDVGGLVVGGPMGATALTSIVSLDPIHCYIDADEMTVLRYQKLNRENKTASPRDDQIPCEMALGNDSGYPYKGVIDFVDNRLDPTTGTIQVRAVFENPLPERGQRALQPGYFARVRVPGGSDYEAFVVDDKAVQSDQAQKIVYVVNEQNIVMPRPIEVGPVINGKRVVRSGLTEKDRIIVNGMAKIGPGMPVNPITEEQAAKAQQTAQNGGAAPGTAAN
ncbi:efflux RND transporter periplasmic adaptor subunit [Roseimicrobium sp. ORNL1]|uniref:efflux RND transporter periplasmic adaptor subunit n=1 Tax=Roseimicrobium sp. ORNL1 TaxID=2711231 RepID=UPI0013E0FA5E|nr:efflux RND transporter periplasmic adaptor subunit [Roseimicrobium sp. ORNL1]QIF01395.1 efflux RND transporter periplasmic adaptor subunit [Roseimicrobium sp. ORNL1]